MSAHLITPFFLRVTEVGSALFIIESIFLHPVFSKIDVTFMAILLPVYSAFYGSIYNYE